MDVTFSADGGYSARCSKAECCLAFYYGTDDNSPLKTYATDTVSLSKEVSGYIDIVFNGHDGDDDYVGWTGMLKKIEVSVDENRVRFDFYGHKGHGPVHFDLTRVQ